jgi:hypothetical protein
MRTKEFNTLSLKERLAVLEKSKKDIFKPLTNYGEFKSDLYLVGNLLVFILAYNYDERVVQAIAVGSITDKLLNGICLN